MKRITTFLYVCLLLFGLYMCGGANKAVKDRNATYAPHKFKVPGK